MTLQETKRLTICAAGWKRLSSTRLRTYESTWLETRRKWTKQGRYSSRGRLSLHAVKKSTCVSKRRPKQAKMWRKCFRARAKNSTTPCWRTSKRKRKTYWTSKRINHARASQRLMRTRLCNWGALKEESRKRKGASVDSPKPHSPTYHRLSINLTY